MIGKEPRQMSLTIADIPYAILKLRGYIVLEFILSTVNHFPIGFTDYHYLVIQVPNDLKILFICNFYCIVTGDVEWVNKNYWEVEKVVMLLIIYI